jgi:hypothetical protein
MENELPSAAVNVVVDLKIFATLLLFIYLLAVLRFELQTLCHTCGPFFSFSLFFREGLILSPKASLKLQSSFLCFSHSWN